MKREEYIKSLIIAKGYNVKEFSNLIGVPYTTLRSILNGNVGGAAVDTAVKICRGLNISVEELKEPEVSESAFHFTDRERNLVLAYRAHPDRQNAVDVLLGIADP